LADFSAEAQIRYVPAIGTTNARSFAAPLKRRHLIGGDSMQEKKDQPGQGDTKQWPGDEAGKQGGKGDIGKKGGSGEVDRGGGQGGPQPGTEKKL
jgi:hypothetical protein